MKVLVFANGKTKDGVMVRRAIATAEDALIIAADGGARIAQQFGLTPHIIIGDMDSLTDDEILKLENSGASIKRYPSEKDETDLELALLYAAEQGATWLRIIGGIGGRFDQMLANVYLLALPALADCDMALVAKKQEISLMRSGTHTLMGAVGDTISLIPVSGDVHGVTTANLQYALHDDTLKFGPARGISNVMESDTAQVTVADGWLICVHTEGRA